MTASTTTKALPKRVREADLDGLRARLETLGLSFAAEALSGLLTQAVKDEQSTPHFLETLLEAEQTRREERRIRRALGLSRPARRSAISTSRFSRRSSGAGSRRWRPAGGSRRSRRS